MPGKRRRLNNRFYILLGILISIVVLIIWLVARSIGGTIDFDTAEFKKSTSIVIVFDETIATSESYGRVSRLALEGATVTGGQKIAEVYMWGYNDNVLQDLSTLEQQINEYQTKELMQDIVDSQLQGFDRSIEEKKQQIAECVNGEHTFDLLQLENELETLLVSRRDYLKAAIQPDETLSRMYDQKQETLRMLDTWKRDVLSTGDGIISFSFDGYEMLANNQTMHQLQPKDISAILGARPLSNATTLTDGQRPLYRIVKPNEWYAIITTTKRDMNRLVLGEKYKLQFDGFYDTSYEGEAVLASRNTNGGVYALKITGDVSPFLSQRTAKSTLTSTVSGLSVNRDAVKENSESVEGIYCKVNGEKEFVPIEIIYASKNKVLFKTDNPAVVKGVYYYNNG